METKQYIIKKKLKAGTTVKKGKVTAAWVECPCLRVDYTALTKDASTIMVQHLRRYAGHVLQNDASTAWRNNRKTGDGPGWSWDLEKAILTLNLVPWDMKIGGSEKQDKLNAAILEKVDEQIEAGVVTLEGRETILRMMGFKGPIPPHADAVGDVEENDETAFDEEEMEDEEGEE